MTEVRATLATATGNITGSPPVKTAITIKGALRSIEAENTLSMSGSTTTQT